jgi:IclR family acetate operon transcriptional repressor
MSDLEALPKTGESSAVRSASRALDILEFVAHASSPPNLPEISRRLGIPKSSLSLLLATLVQRQYLRHIDLRGGYRLGLASERLAVQVTRSRGMVERIVPILRRVSGALNETTSYFERRDGFVECIETESSKQSLAFTIRIGERGAMYANSCGKAILAQLPEDELMKYINETALHPYTATTITDPKKLLEELAEIRRSGISRSFGEYVAGVVAVAVALVDRGVIQGAINVAVPESRYNAAADQAIIQELQAASRGFSRASLLQDAG